MLFNSLEFLVFFPVVTILYFALPHAARWLLLLVASCLFYMALVPVYILILIFTIVVDYIAGILIERSEGTARKVYLGLSIVANIGVLAVFKYAGFLNANLEAVADLFNISYAAPTLSLILPVGLSFHTFQAMSYTIEVYRGHQKAERSFGIYALYVMFYPQLVAGPIERPQNLLPQFHTRHTFDPTRAAQGLKLMAWGFFKKTVIADRLAVAVNMAYGNPHDFTGFQLVVATIAFAFQIYCDFSGYSDIALGAAEVMGFRLMRNFKRPYFAQSISEFWRRWHISLSTWFKDYVYVPLGGNQVSLPRRCFNLMAVFALSGLWHGANWTFVIWGVLHGTYLIVAVLRAAIPGQTKPEDVPARPLLVRGLRMAGVFLLVNLGWIFFRANSVRDAFYIVSSTLSGWSAVTNWVELRAALLGLGLSGREWLLAASAVAILLAVETWQERVNVSAFFAARPWWVRWPIYYAAAWSIIIFGRFGHEQFIYFQF